MILEILKISDSRPYTWYGLRCHCYETTALVGTEDHFGPRDGVGTVPYRDIKPGPYI